MKKNILINLSNHPSSKWSEEQKAGWDEIVDIEFPNISADYDEIQVSKIVDKYLDRLVQLIPEIKAKGSDFNLMLQGEYTFCYMMFDILKFIESWNFWIPTTERIVIEEVKSDGSVDKKSIFRFVKWRRI